MSENAGQRYVLVGPHKGKTMQVNGHPFVGGEYIYYGSHEQIATLTRVFSNYAAIPADMAELAALREERAAVAVATTTPAPAVVEEAAVEQASEEEELAAMLGDATTTPAPVLEEQVPERPSLAEAVGKLDPEDDAHWTSNNLPSIDYLTTLTGKKPSRGEVEAVAEGYTRSKARAIRAA